VRSSFISSFIVIEAPYQIVAKHSKMYIPQEHHYMVSHKNLEPSKTKFINAHLPKKPTHRKQKSHSPSDPKNTLGPSTLCVDPDCESSVDGNTVTNATRSCSNKVGARNASNDRIVAVKASTGAR